MENNDKIVVNVRNEIIEINRNIINYIKKSALEDLLFEKIEC